MCRRPRGDDELAAALRARCRAAHAGGELAPGEVADGKRAGMTYRSDVMKWMPNKGCDQVGGVIADRSI